MTRSRPSRLAHSFLEKKWKHPPHLLLARDAMVSAGILEEIISQPRFL
jgi:hypothetical protein